MFLLLRDLVFRRRAAADPELDRGRKPLDLETLVLSTETAAASGRGESWFTQLVTETGSGFTPETAFLARGGQRAGVGRGTRPVAR